MTRATRALAVIAILAATLFVAWPRIRVVYLATLILVEATTPEVDGPMSRLRADPAFETITFESGGATIVADLYRPPGDGPHPAVVVSHGMDDGGRGDPRLVNIADALARAGFVSLVPEYPSLKSLTVRTSAVDEIVDAYRHAESLPYVDSGRVGLFGVSYAGGLSVVAAADPRITDRVRFCFSLGGHHDLRRVVIYMMTGMYREDGDWVYLEPENYGRWVFLANSVHLVDDADDRAVLMRIAEAKLRDPACDVSADVAELGEEGRNAYALLVCEDPVEAGATIDALGEGIRRYLVALSPSGRVGTLRARLILAHGRDDNMIPYTESVALSAEARSARGVRLVLVDSFRHVDLVLGGRGEGGRGDTIREALRLLALTCDLVSQGSL